jgi:ATP-dependent protease ClpP protease subunit
MRRPMGYAQAFSGGRPHAGSRPRGLGLTDDNGAELWLYDAIDAWADDWWGGVSAAMVVEALQGLGGEPVTVHVNSPGGDVFEAIAMYSTFKTYPGEVTMRVEGLAASAASYLVMAGDRTMIDPNAMMMIHDAWGIEIGNEDEMLKYAAKLGKTSQNLADIYARRSGQGTADTWRATMKAETWYTGTEAIDAGLIGEVIPESAPAATEPPVDLAARFDLSVYARTPAALAGKGRHTREPAPIPHPITPATAGAVTSVNDQDGDVVDLAAILAGMKGLVSA